MGVDNLSPMPAGVHVCEMSLTLFELVLWIYHFFLLLLLLCFLTIILGFFISTFFLIIRGFLFFLDSKKWLACIHIIPVAEPYQHIVLSHNRISRCRPPFALRSIASLKLCNIPPTPQSHPQIPPKPFPSPINK